jgi:hypothetical protein
MISLLHEKEYELVGEVEVRRADWLKIRRAGWFQFVVKWCSTSFGGRIGATAVSFVALSHIDPLRRLGEFAWTALIFGAWYLGASAFHAVRVWRRLEQRFAFSSVE